MTDITVIRGDGDRQGEDIIDPLMSSVGVALQRGRNALDAAALADGVQLTCRFLPDVRNGNLVQVIDPAQGGSYKAMVTGIEHRIAIDDAGNLSIETQLNLRRPR